jgi:hypothetical protein
MVFMLCRKRRVCLIQIAAVVDSETVFQDYLGTIAPLLKNFKDYTPRF